jgi:DNA polymerase-3 subunit beta
VKKTFTADPAVFRAAVTWVARWVPAKPSQPVWAGLLMEARDGQLTLCGYDEDVSARATMSIEGEATGTALVSGKLLRDLVATFPAGKPVQAEADDTVLTLRAGRVVVTLPLMGASDYPTLPVAPPATAMMDGATLAEAIGRVAPAAAKDPAQHAWTPVRLAFGDERLEVIASDSRRVSQVFVTTPGSQVAEALAPAAIVAEAVKMMAGADEVEVGISANLISFAVAGRTLTVRQSAGSYKTTQVHRAVAVEPPVAAVVAVADLLPAVKRAMVMKAEGHPTVLDWTAGEVTVSAKGGEAGSQAGETFNVEYDGPDARIAVNPLYLTDAVEGVNGASVRIAFDPVKPGKALLITDPDDSDYRHVMVPLVIPGAAGKPQPRNQPESMD